MPAAHPSPVRLLIVMGVSGSGKSLIAGLLARRLQWRFADADAFHSPANVDKLRSGHALDDDDRRPWLQALCAWTEALRGAGEAGVLACSALKRSYRDTLVGGRDDVQLVYLRGEPELLARRVQRRHGHFMPPSLLQSQLRTLEEPRDDECPIVVSVDAAPQAILDEIVARLRRSAYRPRRPSPRRLPLAQR